jgi:hypothetical protein
LSFVAAVWDFGLAMLATVSISSFF